jgi:hypothetical protein
MSSVPPCNTELAPQIVYGIAPMAPGPRLPFFQRYDAGGCKSTMEIGIQAIERAASGVRRKDPADGDVLAGEERTRQRFIFSDGRCRSASAMHDDVALARTDHPNLA